MQCLGFTRALLCSDSRLVVEFAANRPFRWTLFYHDGEEQRRDEMGLLFFNYFARRHCSTHQNKHLPPRLGG